MTIVCPRCGETIESENDAFHVGLKEGSVLFSDEKEYDKKASICYGCRWELEDWLGGEDFEDVDITVTVRK
jgi:hypothetical protein